MFVNTKSVPLVRPPLLVFTQNTVGCGIPDALHITFRLLPSVISFFVNGTMDEGSEKMKTNIQQQIGGMAQHAKLRPGYFRLLVEKKNVNTINSDGDIFTHCCTNCVVNLAFVAKHSTSCHCYVPNSCNAAGNDRNIVLIQVISEFRGVGICD